MSVEHLAVAGSDGYNAPQTTSEDAQPRSTANPVGIAVARQGKELALSAVLAVAGALAGLVPYIIVFLVADELFVIRSGQPHRIVTFSIWAGVAVVAKIVLSALANTVSHTAAYRVLADIRIALAEKLSRMPLGRVRAYSSGHLKKVLQDDVEQLELGLSHAIPDLAAAIAVPLASVVAMTFMNWQMALASLLMVVLTVALVIWGIRRGAGVAAEESQAKTKLNTAVISFLRGMKEIRGFLPGPTGFAATDAVISETERIENTKMERGMWQAVGSTKLVGSAVLFLLPLGLWLVHSGALTSSSLIFFLLVGTGFAQPLLNLTISLAVLQYQVEAGLKNINEILQEPDLAGPRTPLVNNGYGIEFRSVRFSYGSQGPEVLHGIDLAVPAGGSLALVGPSGGGKSTIMGLLARFHDPSAGRVLLGGVDLRDMDPVALMQQVAYVQQDDYLFADTLLNNIRMARPDATDDEVYEAAERARVAEFVPELAEGWQTVLPPGGGNLSGGQRQRISIARAMLKGAGVILLDEATAFLDPESERGVEEALADLRRHATVVTIAHRLGSVTDYDQIAYVNHGKIIDVGAHPELLKRCREYAELWSAYQQAQGWHLASNSDLKAATPRRQGGANAAPVANSPRSHQLRRDTRGEVDTPTVTARVRGLSKLGTVKQWLSLLGAHRQDLWHRGIWWIMLDGVLGSAPLVIVLLALLEVLGTGVRADSWWRFGLPLLVIFAARWLVGVALASTWWKSANAAIAALRRGVLTHLRRIPLGEYARLDVGRNATLVNSDLPLVDFTNLPAKVMQGVIQPLLAGAVLMILDWQLAFAALSGLPIFLLLLRLSDRAQRTVLGEVTRERSQATSDLLELVHGTAVLRANPDAPQVSRYHAAVERLRRASVAMAVRTSPLSSLASVALELGFGVLVLLVSVRTTNQTLSQDVAILLLVASLNLYRPYQELMDLSSYRHLQSHIVTRLAEIWDVDPMPDTPSGTAANAAVEMHDVGFSYEPDRPILVNVSFLAQPGEITALVGPSGAGKSTVTNLIARFWDVDSGSVTIGRCDVRELGQEELSDLVTTVYQDVYLFPSTVRENLSMGTDVDDARLEEALRAAQAWDFVDKLPDGLDSELTEGGLNLSGGQRQRLAIARALVKDAPILLLDEAVAAVDPQTEVRIQEALGNLVQERTVIVVAHRLNTVKQVDQIVVLDDHMVEAVGTHTELLSSSPTYHRLWEANTAASR